MRTVKHDVRNGICQAQTVSWLVSGSGLSELTSPCPPFLRAGTHSIKVLLQDNELSLRLATYPACWRKSALVIRSNETQYALQRVFPRSSLESCEALG